ncbi:MAG: efflux transporter outer membrane subunit [Opitutales bacterium]|nr:efflux transporter outer membrane subunit [Opitutales bacterium]
MKRIHSLYYMGWLVLGAGCSTGPGPEDLRPAQPDMPAEGFAAATEDAGTEWVTALAHPELEALVEEAWAANRGLARLAARLDQAEAEARIAGAARRPLITAGAEASRQEIDFAGLGRVRQDSYALSGNLSWEIDLWGRLRDARTSAEAALAASGADYAAARLSLAAQAVRLWVDLAEADAQVRLATETTRSFEANERLTVRRFEAGVADAVEVRLTRANTAAARSAVEARGRQRDGLRRALETLLGRYPAGTFGGAGLPSDLAPVSPGLPADLLERRPDLRAAETRYAAAVHGLSAANKARLPELRLTAAAGLASPELREVLNTESFFWNLIGGLTAPLFDGGRISAEQDRARARVEEAAHAYAEAALAALREVETALAAEHFLRDQESALAEAAAQAREAERLATDRYGRGLTPLTTVLEAQRRAFESESQLLNIRAERHRARVDLILSLGGDFAPAAATASAQPPSLP